MVKLYLYSSVHNFVIAGTDENGENWYMTNNNQFTAYLHEQEGLPPNQQYNMHYMSIILTTFLKLVHTCTCIKKHTLFANFQPRGFYRAKIKFAKRVLTVFLFYYNSPPPLEDSSEAMTFEKANMDFTIKDCYCYRSFCLIKALGPKNLQ